MLPARANTLSSLSRIRAVALQQDQREGVAAREPLPAVGDIIEVFAKERFAYLQVTHQHFYHESRGPVVRVFGSHSEAGARRLGGGATRRPGRSCISRSSTFGVMCEAPARIRDSSPGR